MLTFAMQLGNKVASYIINQLKVYTNMAKYDFIKMLSELKKEFLAYAEANTAKVDEETFEVAMNKYYLTFRVEAEDEDGDTIALTQEIETDSTNDIYQKPIYGNSIHWEY